MKKLISVIISISVLLCSIVPMLALAVDSAPSLKSISFEGATIDSTFVPNELDYTITLANPSEAPTLEAYEINGSANIFVNYSVNENNVQDGITIKLEHDNGAIYYNFKYSNPITTSVNGNNLLKEVSCNLGEVYPKINADNTNYKLYIPSDLTIITLSVATDDLSAVADFPSEITLNESQEPVIPITVTASNGEIREYSLKVKRLSKNSEEIIKEMAKPNFKSIVYGELFYQKPEFTVGIICAAGGIILVIASIFVAKRIMIKVGDDEEEEFFD